VRPYLFGAIPTRGTSGNEKIQRDEGGGTALTRIQVKEMIRTENFWWSEENYWDSPQCVAKWMVFLRDGIRGILTKHKLVTLCTKCRPILGSAGSAGPRGPATWTDTDGFFFLERASPTPTWIRPLVQYHHSILSRIK
jgi:hypothetical protein